MGCTTGTRTSIVRTLSTILGSLAHETKSIRAGRAEIGFKYRATRWGSIRFHLGELAGKGFDASAESRGLGCLRLDISRQGAFLLPQLLRFLESTNGLRLALVGAHGRIEFRAGGAEIG